MNLHRVKYDSVTSILRMATDKRLSFKGCKAFGIKSLTLQQFIFPNKHFGDCGEELLPFNRKKVAAQD